MSEEMRQAYHRLVEQAPDPPSWDEVTSGRLSTTDASNRRRGPLVGLAAAVTVVAAIGAVALFAGPSPAPLIPTDDAAADGSVASLIAGRWSRADSTLGSEPNPGVFAIGEGRVLVIHPQNRGQEVTGEIWDSATNTAATVAGSGLAWRANAPMAWTGSELLIVGGSNGPGIDQLAAAYHPDTDTWRPLPDPPQPVDAWENAITGTGVWTGTELMVPRQGVAFDPDRGDWRATAPLPGPPRTAASTVWTGEEVIVWGGCDTTVGNCDDLGQGQLSDGWAYDPDTDRWRALPGGPLAGGIDPVAVWTGAEMLVFAGTGSPDDGATAAGYRPSSDTWRPLPPPPLTPRRHAAGVWTGDAFIIWGGGSSGEPLADGALYDPDTGTWHSLPPAPPGAARRLHAMTWVADRLYISWGTATSGPIVLAPAPPG